MSLTRDPLAPPRAVILRFSNKRGRPKKLLPAKDGGTPELARKRQVGETVEALDLCLQRGVITSEQHWCGIHLRWLYTLRHGAPSVRAIDPTHLGGMDITLDDPQWKAAREAEYHEAVIALQRGGHAIIVMNLCIYNERPAFLQRPSSFARRPPDIGHLLRGLDVLAALWIRKR